MSGLTWVILTILFQGTQISHIQQNHVGFTDRAECIAENNKLVEGYRHDGPPAGATSLASICVGVAFPQEVQITVE